MRLTITIIKVCEHVFWLSVYMSFRPYISNFGSVGDRDELIRFQDQKVIGHSKTTHGEISTLEGISHLS